MSYFMVRTQHSALHSACAELTLNVYLGPHFGL